MTKDRGDRLLAASLHQTIADEPTARLDFYEYWLNPDGMRDGTIGLAQLSAVIGVMRTEGRDYDVVMTRAGRLMAAWTIAALPAVQGRALRWLLGPLRVRAALRIVTGILSGVNGGRRPSWRVRGHHVNVDVAGTTCVVTLELTGEASLPEPAIAA